MAQERTVDGIIAAMERAFAFLEADGFALAQSTTRPVAVWFKAPERGVRVVFDPADAALDVELEDRTTGDRYALYEILGVAADAKRPTNMIEPGRIERELELAGRLLREHGAKFLAGDAAGFREQHREALLVGRIRAAGNAAFWAGDLKRAQETFELIRPYWNEVDRECHMRSTKGDGPLRRPVGALGRR